MHKLMVFQKTGTPLVTLDVVVVLERIILRRHSTLYVVGPLTIRLIYLFCCIIY